MSHVRLIILGLCLLASAAGAVELPPEHVKFFEDKIRPLLVENCFECHADKKQKGGLRLDSYDALHKGGKNGKVVVAGKPEESRIIEAVRYGNKDFQMPPEERLGSEKVALLEQWVKMGAPFPKTALVGVAKSKKRVITEQDRRFWSFGPVKEYAPPAVKDGTWATNDVDRFILAKLEAEGLSPAPIADKATLIRRAYFDLWGIPPTPDEIEAFVKDHSADAWPKLIDRLLASPRYGERWARHWLDLVRYAESDGYKQDAYRENAWPYRDYVIKSFNDDKPYDRFIMEQLAGDEIDRENPDVLIGTAFLRHGIYEYNQASAKLQWETIVEEVTDVTADVFLGLSMGCAKCHDHKFDPILQTDYYRLKAFFQPMLPQQTMPLASIEQKAKYDAAYKKWEEKTADIRAKIAAIEAKQLAKLTEDGIGKFPLDVRDVVRKPASERTPYEEQIAQIAMRQIVEKTAVVAPKLDAKAKTEYDALKRQLGEFDNEKPKPLMTALVVTDVGAAAPPTTVPGDREKTQLPAGYPVVLDHTPLAIPEIKASATSTGRRLALAKWLSQANHPLVPRVAVNRIWQYHFGRGLVGTSSDFGTLGDRPTHPELLDWLASRFVSEGWSFKKMHRQIMLSSAYRQSSITPMPPIARQKDPENKWLWKYQGRRLDGEQIRDAMLLASGELKLDMFGPAVDPVAPRRSIYTKQFRNVRDPLLDAFDLPDSFGSAASRNSTTTAMQALLMINGDWPLKRAEMMAARVKQSGASTTEELAQAAWRFAYGRSPNDKELRAAAAFLALPRDPIAAQDSALSTQDSPQSIDHKPIVKTMPHIGTQAVYVRGARTDDVLRLSNPQNMPGEDFTVEAYIQLESIYEDASVRVIASQWDGKPTSPGWSFGVTSTKSKHEPRNLILQLVGKEGYEVIPSGFRIDLHKTYYVAVSVKIADTSEAGITFHLKDITDMDAPLKSVAVRHRITAAYASDSPLVIGGRDSAPMHGWDGLIDEVRISKKSLLKDELLYNDGAPAKALISGHWVFEDQPGIFKDSAAVQKDLTKPAAGAKTAIKAAARPDAALIDLCHVLLNSNEFLYLD